MGTWSMRNLIHRLFGHTWQLTLNRGQGCFELRISLDDRTTPLENAIKRPELSWLKDLTATKNGKIIVPPAKLNEFLTFSEPIDGLTVNFRVSPQIASLKLVEQPQTFKVRFVWSATYRRILPEMDHGIAYFGDGWFVGKSEYWSVPGVQPKDDDWLCHSAKNRDLEAFLFEFCPTWEVRGLPFLTDLKWVFHLDKRGDYFELTLSCGDQVFPIQPNIGKLGLSTEGLTYVNQDKAIVPLARLEELLMAAKKLSNSKLEFRIAPEIASLKRTDVPEDFKVYFDWADQHQRIFARIGNDATYVGDGWFIGTNRYWHVPGMSSHDDHWLRDTEKNRNLELFFKSFLPTWKDRGLPFLTDLEYCEIPAMKICIKKVDANRIVLETAWSMSPELTKNLPSFPEHVICGRTIAPGISPDNLPDRMQEDSTVALSDENVAKFMTKIWPRIRKWAEGDVPALEHFHQIYEKSEFLLRIERDEHRGIGIVWAISKVKVDEFEVNAEEIYRQFGVKRYFRIGNGWLPIRAGGIGLPGLRGTKLSFRLTTKEILDRKSGRFVGPWSGTDFSAVDQLIDQRFTHHDGIRHINWLIALGISGSLVGSHNMTGDSFVKTFSQLKVDHPDIRILVVGPKKAQNLSGLVSVASVDFSAESKGITLVTPKEFEGISSSSNRPWDILCILEADLLVRSSTSKIFHKMVSFPKKLVITQFTDSDFLHRKAGREAWSQLLGIDDDSVWVQCLLDLCRSSSESLHDMAANKPKTDNPPFPRNTVAKTAVVIDLPSRSPEKNKDTNARITREPGSSSRPDNNDTTPAKPAEFTIGSQEGISSFPIPPPEESFNNNRLGTLWIQGPFATHETGFAEKARKLAMHKETAADFCPFMCYWPTYDSMTEQQRRWYFYWRGEVREGRYPDTDLSYIFVHIYELINNIGVLNAADGYEQLQRLWHSYRGRHPKLDRYLTDWIFDYVLFHKCSIDPFQFLRESVELGAPINDPDLVLPLYVESGLEDLPVSLLESYTNYRIQTSRFYIAGNQELIQEFCSKSLARVNAFMKTEEGVGIFDIFKPNLVPAQKRSPFRSAVHEFRGDLITIPAKIPYSQHGPLRDFLTSVIKYTENKLREKKSFGGRLTGIELPKDFQNIIDQLIAESISSIRPPLPKPVVRIDFGKVSRLEKESDEVRELLLQAISPEPSLSIASPESHEYETGTSGSQIDQEPLKSGVGSQSSTPTNVWAKFMSLLSDFQVETLMAIIQGSDVVDKITEIAARNLLMPELLIDMINELALDTTGDIIIVPGSNPPEIEEESFEQVKQVIQIRR